MCNKVLCITFWNAVIQIWIWGKKLVEIRCVHVMWGGGGRPKVPTGSNLVPRQSKVEPPQPLLLIIITETPAEIKSNTPAAEESLSSLFIDVLAFITHSFLVTFQCCLLTSILTKYWMFSNFPLTIKDNLKGCVYFVKWCNIWNIRSLLLI